PADEDEWPGETHPPEMPVASYQHRLARIIGVVPALADPAHGEAVEDGLGVRPLAKRVAVNVNPPTPWLPIGPRPVALAIDLVLKEEFGPIAGSIHRASAGRLLDPLVEDDAGCLVIVMVHSPRHHDMGPNDDHQKHASSQQEQEKEHRQDP